LKESSLCLFLLLLLDVGQSLRSGPKTSLEPTIESNCRFRLTLPPPRDEGSEYMPFGYRAALWNSPSTRQSHRSGTESLQTFVSRCHLLVGHAKTYHWHPDEGQKSLATHSGTEVERLCEPIRDTSAPQSAHSKKGRNPLIPTLIA
jgi:hypothetical protein